MIPRVTRLPYLAWGAFLLLTGLGLNRGIWLDEYGALAFAFSRNSFLTLAQSYNHPPLYYFLLSWWATLGSSEVFLRALSLVFGLVTIGGVAAAVRRLKPDAANIAAFAVAVHPALLWHHQEIRPYGLVFATTALCLFCTIRQRQEPTRRHALWLFFSILLSLASHTVALLAVPLWLLGAGRLNKKILVGAATASMTLFLWVVFPNLFRADWWYPAPSWALLSRIFLNQMGVIGWRWALPLFAFFFLLLVGGKDRNRLPFLWGFLWLWGVSLLVSVALIPMMLPRSLAFALIFLLPGLAISLVSLGPRWAVLGKVLALGVAALWISGWLSWGLGPREAFKEVFVELKDKAESRDLIVLSPYHLRGLRVGTFYTDYTPQNFHYLGFGPLWDLPARLALFERGLAIRALPKEGTIHLYVVSRKGPARWLRQYLDGLVGPADRHWRRGHLHVWRFTLDKWKQEHLLERWAGQRWLRGWTEYYNANPQMPWPPPFWGPLGQK